MNEQRIWDTLLNLTGGNAFGAAGLMGNLYAESALNPRNLQQSFEKKLGYTDDSYTEAVDSGAYANFVHDGAGYGLAQWTYWSRKEALLGWARNARSSIGDLVMQLDFLTWELRTNYSGVLDALRSATSVRAASDAVLTGYERPKDQSEAVRVKRAAYGQKYYDRFAGGETVENYDKYIHSTGTHYIANSGKDENNAYHGGKAGDQTGHEFELRKWYSRPWTVVLRYPDAAVALLIARLGCAAALNDRIGYDQDQRGTYWTQLQKAGYDPSKITAACEEDCTAGVSANVKAAGALMGIQALKDLPLCSSRNMKQKFTAAGFQALTASKYLTGTDFLYPGDILLCENHHAATNVTCGRSVRGAWEKAMEGGTEQGAGLSRGDYGTAVTAMQRALLAWDATCLPRCGADGDFGGETEAALTAFQAEAGLPVTGVYDEATRKALAGALPQSPAATAPSGREPLPQSAAPTAPSGREPLPQSPAATAPSGREPLPQSAAATAPSGREPVDDGGTDASELSDAPVRPAPGAPAKYVKVREIHVRSAPGDGYMSLGTVQPGYRLPYAGETHRDANGVPWHLVEYDGQNGWLCDKDAEVIP